MYQNVTAQSAALLELFNLDRFHLLHPGLVPSEAVCLYILYLWTNLMREQHVERL